MLCNFSKFEPLKVTSFERFKVLCLAKFAKDNDNLLERHLTAGCVRCPTGAAIKAGRLTTLPDNVGLITIEETKPMPSATVEITLPSGIDRKVLAVPELKELTSPGLRSYWLVAIPKAKSIGICVNCGREQKINGCGLCSKCYYAGHGREGLALLSALAAVELELRSPDDHDVVNRVPAFADEDTAYAMDELQSASPPQLAVEEALPPHTSDLNAVDRHWKIQDLEEKVLARDEMIGKAIDALLGEGEEIDNLDVLVRRRMEELNELRNRVNGGTMVVDGYQPLFAVLTQALDQAQKGKGQERHANGLPFLNQPIMTETRSVGLGFAAGQARKKILEAINCCEAHPERALADLLGAINYTAALVIGIKEKHNA